MANEIKSDIRDVVSAVDAYFPEKRSYSRGSSSGESDKPASKYNIEAMYTPGSSSETVIQLINKSNNSTLSDEEKSLYKSKLLVSTVASISSQDSGINLSFPDHEDLMRRRSYDSFNPAHRISEGESERLDSSNENLSCKWVCPTKVIWQSTVEALQEYEMIKDGDKVLVCLSGGKDSMSLLHTLLQYQSHVYTKGISFSLGAVIVDPEKTGCDPSVLLPHLKALGVHYILNNQTEGNTSK